MDVEESHQRLPRGSAPSPDLRWRPRESRRAHVQFRLPRL